MAFARRGTNFDDAEELEGVQSFDITGGQATKASLLKSAKKPVAGVPITSTSSKLFDPAPSLTSVEPTKQGKVRSESGLERATGPTLASEDEDSPFFTPPTTPDLDPPEGDPAKDPYEAAQRVIGAKTGLDRLAAMQDTKYQLGSGSALGQAPRQLGTRSGAMRRAARSLRRVGATTQANQMFSDAATQKLNEPSIMTEEQRGRVAAKQQEAIDLTRQNQAFDKKYMDYANKLLDKRLKGLAGGGPIGAFEYQRGKYIERGI